MSLCVTLCKNCILASRIDLQILCLMSHKNEIKCKVGRRNPLELDLNQDISWAKGQHKIRYHQRHHKRQLGEQPFPISQTLIRRCRILEIILCCRYQTSVKFVATKQLIYKAKQIRVKQVRVGRKPLRN